jgi:NADPH2:quinone reductase
VRCQTARMRAWQVPSLGEPATVLRLAELDVPQPAPGQVTVRVLAAAANFPDVLMCRGQYQERPNLPFTPGVELCGEVSALGEGLHGVAVGDRVMGMPIRQHGSFAEYSVLPGDLVFPAPPELDAAEAAAFCIAYQTGWFALHKRTTLRPGETLLVHAAAGGVGSAAIQLGKAAGATVIGVVGGAAKAELAWTLGPDLVIDRHTEDFVAVVKEFTAGRGVDVVYDPVGGDAYAGSTKCIAFEGRILVIGFAGGTVPTAQLNHALIKNYSIIGLHWGLYRTMDPAAVFACHAELTKLVADGAIRPLVSERIRLEQVPDALQRLADGATVGRICFVA